MTTVSSPLAAPARYRSKTASAWLALVLGAIGAHRFYLFGLRDMLAWLHVAPAVLGFAGVVRMRNLGQDDITAWLLIPLLGLVLTTAMLQAIVYALVPDEKWQQRYNPGLPSVATRWAPVFAAVLALLIGGTVFMGTVAFAGQKFFEWQLKATTADGSTGGTAGSTARR